MNQGNSEVETKSARFRNTARTLRTELDALLSNRKDIPTAVLGLLQSASGNLENVVSNLDAAVKAFGDPAVSSSAGVLLPAAGATRPPDGPRDTRSGL